MSDKVKFQDQFESLFKDLPITLPKTKGSTRISVDGKFFNYENHESVMKLFTAERVLKYDLGDWYKQEPVERVDTFKAYLYTTWMKDKIQAEKDEYELQQRINQDADYDRPDPDYIIDKLQPVRVLGAKGREAGFQFIDRETKKVTPYDYHAVYFPLLTKMKKELIEQFMARAIHIQDFYSPHRPFGIDKVPDSNNVYDYNRYVPPTWKDEKPSETELDEDMRAFMEHLFPGEEDRDFVWTWIYHSLTSRSGTYLYLCGGQATGKNTLAKILAGLHGEGNTSFPKQDSLKGRFNYFLKDKTFIFFDEFNCRTRQDKDTLKSIINDRVQLEGKGRDHEDIDIHASYMIANNSLQAIGLDPVDRRFSVPQVTDEPLLSGFRRTWTRAFNEKVQSPEFIRNLGHWILTNYRDFKWASDDTYSSPRREEIVLATARDGFKETLDKIINREQINYEYMDERDSYQAAHKGRSRYPDIYDWQKFFREVTKDGQPIVKVDGYTLTPTAEFRKPGKTHIHIAEDLT